MTPAAWRIVRAPLASTAFDGEGARRFGGRWNSPGTRVVYCSATLSLAALETLVHLNPPMPLRHAAIPIRFDPALVETWDPARLPAGWTRSPGPAATRAIGDRWVREARSAVLAVPSVIVPSETNYLLNPSHPDFKKIRMGTPRPFAFDPRLGPS